MAHAPAGWYPDPTNPARTRYWDGARWTDAAAPAPPTVPPPPSGPALAGPATPAWAQAVVPPPVAPVRRLGIAVQALLGVSIATMLYGAVTQLQRAGLVADLLDGDVPTLAAMERADDAVVLGQLVSVGSFVLTGMVWLVWFHRSARNCRALAGRDLVHSPGWAVGAWFVPILNLFRPKQIADDLFRATAAAGDTRPVPRVVHLWWGLFLAASLATRVPVGDPERIESFVGADRWGAAVDAVFAAAGVAAIAVVRGLDHRQQARLAERRAGHLPAVVPVPATEWVGRAPVTPAPAPPPLPF